MRQGGFVNILLIIIIVALVGAGVYVVLIKRISSPVPTLIPTPSPTPTPTPTPTPSPTPKSSPTPTPTSVPNGEKIIKKVGERESSFLIKKINSNSVEGLWFKIYPIERPNDQGTPKTLFTDDDIGYACEGVSEKLISINYSDQTVTFKKVVGQPPYGGCPICLSGKTLIDTPSGLVAVKDLQVGMPIWTSGKSGHRVSGVVEKISRVPVPPTHQMVHLILDDGRELFVSPPHPTIDGRTVGNLVVSDLYDGSRVVLSERVVYGGIATYDILPSGETGFYWANGILLDSTLH